MEKRWNNPGTKPARQALTKANIRLKPAKIKDKANAARQARAKKTKRKSRSADRISNRKRNHLKAPKETPYNGTGATYFNGYRPPFAGLRDRCYGVAKLPEE